MLDTPQQGTPDDANIYGHAKIIGGPIADDILHREVTLAFGSNRHDKNWRNVTTTIGALLVNKLTTFQRGPKDGECMLQGELVAGQRLANNVKACHLLMLDHDTGETLDEITQKIIEAGLFAVLWTTHSHLKTETQIPESKITAWMTQNKLSGSFTTEIAKRYLAETQKLKPWLIDTSEVVGSAHVEDGVKYQIKHAPMPRVRSLYVLEKPFFFSGRNSQTQKQSIVEWNERYAGASVALELAYDRSCIDPSRLMYLPRIPAGAVVGPGQHEIRILSAGGLLDLEAVERVVLKGGGASNPFIATGGRSRGERNEWKTPGLARFLKLYAHDFRASEWLRTLGLENRGAEFPDGMHTECPREQDGHTSPDPTATCFRVWDGDKRDGGFHMFCQHEGCISESGEDRAWYLDALCVKHGVMDAAELEAFSETATKAAEEKAALPAKIAAAIAACNKESPTAQIEATLRLMAQRAAGLQDEADLEALKKATVWGLKSLRSSLANFRKELGQKQQGSERADDEVEVPPPPAVGREGEAVAVLNPWDHQDQVRVARGIFERENAKAPAVFKSLEGKFVRLIQTETGAKIKDMTHDDWSNRLGAKVKYLAAPCGKLKGCPLPGPVIAEIRGEPHLDVPVLEQIIHAPIFDRDGNLRVARGYQSDLKVYLDPRGEFLPVSASPSVEEVREAMSWIEEAFCDFPFSDAFDGQDTKPYKTGEPSADGYRETNWDRGYASRWNTYAALLHPQLRHLMPEGSSAPPYHLDKIVAGEGAGYAMNAINVITTGSELPIRVYNEKNPGEFEKGIPASLRSGDPIIGIDNIVGKINSPPLAALATASVWVARVFGRNDTEMRIPTKAMWLFAGNSARFSDEVVQRMVPIRLDFGLRDPAGEREGETATYFKHHPLIDWVKANRPQLCWALHTLIGAWFAAGQPKGKAVHPRFPEYGHVVGGVLENAASVCEIECGFLGNLEAYKEHANEDADAYAAVFQRLVDGFHGRPFTMTEVVQALRNPMTGRLDEFLDLPVSSPTAAGEVIAFSLWFKSDLRQRPFHAIVTRAVAAFSGWMPHSEVVGDRCEVRLRIVKAGKDDAKRWQIVPVVSG